MELRAAVQHNPSSEVLVAGAQAFGFAASTAAGEFETQPVEEAVVPEEGVATAAMALARVCSESVTRLILGGIASAAGWGMVIATRRVPVRGLKDRKETAPAVVRWDWRSMPYSGR